MDDKSLILDTVTVACQQGKHSACRGRVLLVGRTKGRWGICMCPCQHPHLKRRSPAKSN
jgi:hypothetical protein